MSRIRFATARALFEAFPEVSRKIGVKPTDQFPIDFLKTLTSEGKFEDAVTFCSYLLPRREAVWWACGCARALVGDIARDQAPGLVAAEAWVHEPDDEHRQAALDIGTKGDGDDPLTWLALAAGWAGGFLVSGPNRQVPMPQHMTARAARVAALISALKISRDQRPVRLHACIAEGMKLAETGL
jgi:hypothetical protein